MAVPKNLYCKHKRIPTHKDSLSYAQYALLGKGEHSHETVSEAELAEYGPVEAGRVHPALLLPHPNLLQLFVPFPANTS